MAGWALGTDAWIWMGVWALLVVLAVWLLVREPRRAHRDDPSENLRDRFARGDLSEEEFRRATAALDEEIPVAGAKGRRHYVAHHAQPGQEARHD